MPSASSGLGVPARCASNLLHNLTLSLLVLGYVMMGGLLFHKLEAGHEIKQKANVKGFRDECLRELWLITERLNVLYERNWTHLVDAQLRKFERSVVEASHARGADLIDADPRWSYSGAVLYSVTVVTTVGYGNVAPRTAEGKLATMLYALLGVPLMLVCLSNLGAVCARSLQAVYLRVTCGRALPRRPDSQRKRKPACGHQEARGTLVAVGPDCSRAVCSLTPEARQLLRQTQRPPDSDDDDPDHPHTRLAVQHATPSRVPLIWRAPGEPRRAPTPPPRRTPPLHASARVPPVLVLLLLAAYLGLGAAAFASWAGWGLLDAAYFCFVTLSTIGFGDMVPARSLAKDGSESQVQAVACCAYLVFGLLLLATSFSLLQDEVVSRGRHFANAVGLVKREDLAV